MERTKESPKTYIDAEPRAPSRVDPEDRDEADQQVPVSDRRAEEADEERAPLTEDIAEEAVRVALTAKPAGRIPSSTYRLQFSEDFTFTGARRFVPYLYKLGVSDLYASPYFQARSPHGYDINAHDRINPALGDEEEYEALMERLRQHGMGHIMDVVPNHMGIVGGENAWWNDVLENAQSSPYAPFFDIDWQPLKSEMKGQVLLPTLGEQYGRVLESGELVLDHRDGSFFLRYYDNEFPIAPDTYAPILEIAQERLRAGMMADAPAVIELESILTAISNLPERDETEAERIRERQREKEVIKRRIARLVEEEPQVATAIDVAVQAFNGQPGEPHTFDRLDELLRRQAYRLAYWRVAAEEINYRRFFDINELAAIRVELPEVFRQTHKLVMELVGAGVVTGLRIDHPDGLWDPEGYFAALQRTATAERAYAILKEERGPLSEDELALLNEQVEEMGDLIVRAKPLYIVAEKIVSHGEELPQEWAVHGTTGYEFLNAVGGLFVDRASERAFSEIYSNFIGGELDFDDLVYRSKRRILHTSLASELIVLAHRLDRLSERNRLYRDFTLNSLTEALREVIAAFPVYRTYVNEETQTVSDRDRAAIQLAVRKAKQRNPDLDVSIFDFLQKILTLEVEDFSPVEAAAEREFVMKLQQLTGPVMAKGMEDTAFYIYNRLVALNEVGGEPDIFGTSLVEFHLKNLERSRHWPHAMLTTSTHDTKRSEDVRARIAVLSEMPETWREALEEWGALNRSKKERLDGATYPTRNDEYLLYQTLIGAWPLESMSEEEHAAFTDRIVAYMIKAARESKVNTSWRHTDEAYEQALEQFVRQVTKDRDFLECFLPLQRRAERYGAINSLSQVLLKFTAPGVPDLYQGNEMWRFSLVDPDNRRPVDYVARARALDSLQQPPSVSLAQELQTQWRDGRIKLWVTHRLLTHRRANDALYRDGSYTAIEASGPAASHVVAFVRSLGDQSVVSIAPRLMLRLSQGADSPRLGREPWAETTIPLPPGTYVNRYTGEVIQSEGSVSLSKIFAAFPVGHLERVER